MYPPTFLLRTFSDNIFSLQGHLHHLDRFSTLLDFINSYTHWPFFEFQHVQLFANNIFTRLRFNTWL